MTNEEFHRDVLAELTAIRKLLETRPATGTPAQRGTSSYSTPSAAQAEIPQPTDIIESPGDVQVHFGKNNGVALGKLSERSVEWYATDQDPKLDSSGKPYPPRPQEIILKNAARQLYHQRKGTLANAPAQTRIERKAEEARSGGGSSPAVDDGGEVPFAPRHLEHG